jgi:hypothetical protein
MITNQNEMLYILRQAAKNVLFMDLSSFLHHNNPWFYRIQKVHVGRGASGCHSYHLAGSQNTQILFEPFIYFILICSVEMRN